MRYAYLDPETGDEYPSGCSGYCAGCDIPECHDTDTDTPEDPEDA